MVLPLLMSAALAVSAAQTPLLRIVVVEGEDAVNIVQQKTAVAPVVEVRDRNDQPVAGAVVRFAIRSGRATFGGPRTLTLTTNAAGRAAVTTLTPTGSGALQIAATASFQGQTAAVTIAQTNVMTVAQAAAASAGATGAGGAGGGSTAGGAAGGAGGGGGGVSTTTVAIVGGAAAGGAVTAVKLAGDPEPVPPTTTRYTGTYSVAYDRVFTSKTSTASCTYTIRNAGTVTLNLTDDKGSITGDFDAQNTETVLSVNGCSVVAGSTVNGRWQGTVTGSTGSFSGSKNNTGIGASGNTVSQTLTFTASVSASVVTGTMTWNDRLDSTIDVGVGTATTSVTLR